MLRLREGRNSCSAGNKATSSRAKYSCSLRKVCLKSTPAELEFLMPNRSACFHSRLTTKCMYAMGKLVLLLKCWGGGGELSSHPYLTSLHSCAYRNVWIIALYGETCNPRSKCDCSLQSFILTNSKVWWWIIKCIYIIFVMVKLETL